MSETPHLQTWLQKKENVREKITRHLNKARLDDQIRQKSLTDVFANLSNVPGNLVTWNSWWNHIQPVSAIHLQV